MTAIPVASSETANNPTLKVPYDQQKDLTRRVGKLERPTNSPGGTGWVTQNELATGLAGKADVGLSNFSSLDFPSIAAGGTEELTIVVVGAVAGDTVALGPPDTIEAGLMWSGYVSALDTVTIRLHNTTAAPIDPASASWKASIIP